MLLKAFSVHIPARIETSPYSNTFSDEDFRRLKQRTRGDTGARAGEVTEVADAAELLGDCIVW